MHMQFLFRAWILISRICSKDFWNWIWNVSWFWQRSRFLIEINQTFRAAPKSGISRIEWRRKFESNHSRICSKSCSNWICSASCFRERNHFLTEIKPSELQIWHLENRTEKKIWQNSFKNLLQELFKLNLQNFMFSREKPFFDWMQTVKTLQ